MLHDALRDERIHVAHITVAGRIAPGADNEPGDVAEVLWTHHVDRRVFQTRLGMPDQGPLVRSRTPAPPGRAAPRRGGRRVGDATHVGRELGEGPA